MLKCHIYIDGTWLFKQCGKDSILAKKTVKNAYYIDFKKLRDLIINVIKKNCENEISIGSLWYYTSIIRNIPNCDARGKSLDFIINMSKAKDKSVESAKNAGFNVSGVFDVEYKEWMSEAITKKTYQEKMVDTSLVARMVLQCTENKNDFHVLISGDLDMLPAVSLVVPDYLEKIVLFTTHPDQWDVNLQQSSKKLTDFSFYSGPYYIDLMTKDFMSGNHILECSNCRKLFSNISLPRSGQNYFCPDCLSNRPARKSL